MIYFFYGEEDFNIEQEINKLKKGLDKSFIKKYDNPKLPDLIAIVRSVPMIKTLVEINITKGVEETAELENALECVSENLDIVFVAAQKPDSRKKLFKVLSKYNAKEFPVIPTYKTAELEAWITKQGRSKEIKCTPDALKA